MQFPPTPNKISAPGLLGETGELVVSEVLHEWQHVQQQVGGRRAAGRHRHRNAQLRALRGGGRGERAQQRRGVEWKRSTWEVTGGHRHCIVQLGSCTAASCGRESRRAQAEGVGSAPACWLRTVQLAQANRVGRACVDPRPFPFSVLKSVCETCDTDVPSQPPTPHLPGGAHEAQHRMLALVQHGRHQCGKGHARGLTRLVRHQDARVL